MGSEKPRMHESWQICLNALVVSSCASTIHVTHNGRIHVIVWKAARMRVSRHVIFECVSHVILRINDSDHTEW